MKCVSQPWIMQHTFTGVVGSFFTGTSGLTGLTDLTGLSGLMCFSFLTLGLPLTHRIRHFQFTQSPLRIHDIVLVLHELLKNEVLTGILTVSAHLLFRRWSRLLCGGSWKT